MVALLTPPFRADHVGSLLRPAAVLQARQDATDGRITAEERRAIEDDAVVAMIRMQEEVGLRAATDGELRRGSWHMDFIYRLGGVEKTQSNLAVRFHNERGDLEFTPSAPRITGPLRLDDTIFGDDFSFVRDHVVTATAKQTIPSPSMVHYRGGRAAVDHLVYPDMEKFWADLTAAYGEEIRRLHELGCIYLQLDDTALAYLNDPVQRAELAARGEDAERLHLRYIDHINAALARRPEAMRITTHLCRGNFRSSWVATGGYDYVADALFNRLDVDGFFMEFDDERSGGFEPLRFLPAGKMLVLGLVTTKRGVLETADALARRIEEAARFASLEQLCLSPQCGFASTVEGNALSYDEQVAKLRLVVDTAALVWGD